MNLSIPDGFWPSARDYLTALSAAGPLPPIRGTWYWVDPTSGTNGADGISTDRALASLFDSSGAYDRCVSGAGDGIVLLSRGTGTASQTTSYATQELAWTKHGITVVGACAPVKSFMRSRLANKSIVTTATLTAVADTSISRATGSFITDGWVAGMKFITNVNAAAITVVTVSALSITVTGTLTVGAHTSMTSINVNLITVSGSNNAFYNTMMWNGGSNALEIGGVVVSGARNYFGNCHIAGAMGAATAATNYSLKLDAAEEACFEGGTIGSDTVAQGNNAASEILLSGAVARNRFLGVEVQGYVTAGTAHGAIKSASTSGGRPTAFRGCLFNYALSTAVPAALHIVTGSTDKIILQDCASVNVTANGTQLFNNVGDPTAAAAGGLSTTA